MATDNLTDFIKEALSSGASRDATENALRQAGWSSEQIRTAMSEYAEVEFPIPVPRPRPYTSAKEAFFYLVMFIMLYLSAYNLYQLLVSFIDLGFAPEVVNRVLYLESRVRSATAGLIVAFPVFIYFSWLVTKQVQQEPARRASGIRKWLTYLTLAAASCIIVGDLIALVNRFLSGSTTLPFVLKFLVVGAIATGIFLYYLLLMRQDEAELAK